MHDILKINLVLNSIFYLVNIEKYYIVEYLPAEFNKIREKYGFQNIRESLLLPNNYLKLFKLLNEEGGRSEAFIFSTDDQKFILKTITRCERKIFINKISSKYFERMINENDSRLVKILAVFKIQPIKQDIIIMENLIYEKNNCIIFDLKGSKVHRIVKEIENPKDPPCGVVLKDINFFEYCEKIKLSESDKIFLIESLSKDFSMLKELKIMDYSILLGIYNSLDFHKYGKFESLDGYRFSLGIIDFFQEYNFIKISETKLKKLFHKKEDISSISPEKYYKRILSLVKIILV